MSIGIVNLLHKNNYTRLKKKIPRYILGI